MKPSNTAYRLSVIFVTGVISTIVLFLVNFLHQSLSPMENLLANSAYVFIALGVIRVVIGNNDMESQVYKTNNMLYWVCLSVIVISFILASFGL
ncbi:MAG: hypothetical protein V4686_02605 [Patescibacteria group bacterium]